MKAPMKVERSRNFSESSHEDWKVVSFDLAVDVKAHVEPDGQCAL